MRVPRRDFWRGKERCTACGGSGKKRIGIGTRICWICLGTGIVPKRLRPLPQW